MADQCKFCNSTDVEWAEFPRAGWRLLNPNGTVHRCPEYMTKKGKQVEAAKKKAKHGAFLRLYGPKSAPTHAVLTQTKAPAAGTPEAMAAEIDNEPRDPTFAHLVR